MYPFVSQALGRAALRAVGELRRLATAGGASAVRVSTKDLFYEPKAATVKAGRVALTLVNGGKLPHTFTIDGVVNVKVAAGKSQTVRLDLKPGSYRVYCAEPGHKGAGMVGTLTAS